MCDRTLVIRRVGAVMKFGWFFVCCFAALNAHATDIQGSKDLPEINRPLGSSIVRYSEVDRSAIRLPLERVERVNNRLEIDRELYIDGQLIDITYQLGPRYDYSDYVDELRELLVVNGAELLFSCKSRGCGSSGLWANTLFKVRELYGPNGRQKYFAVKLPGAFDRYLSVYGIEQGNRRQYVQVRIIRSGVDERGFQGVDALVSRSRVVLPIQFAEDQVSSDSRDLISEIANNLKHLDSENLAVVAYSAVAPGGFLDDSIRQSAVRAEHVRKLLEEAGFSLKAAHGLGALSPSDGLSPERVEIIQFR